MDIPMATNKENQIPTAEALQERRAEKKDTFENVESRRTS
jgi:hypothetical protein